jgi:hypothetical protein
MKHLILAFLMFCATAAHAAPEPPSCWLVTNAKGYTVGSSDAGQFAAWWCPDGAGDWDMALLVSRSGYTLKHPTLPAGASPAATADAYWRANVAVDCFTVIADAAMSGLCDRAWDAGRLTRPLPPFIVRPNGTALTRPTYPVINGVRSTLSNGTVPILDAHGRPTACDPVQKLGSYMRVKRTPDLVALCSPS